MAEPFSSHCLKLYWGGSVFYATSIRRSVSSSSEVDVTNINSTVTSDPNNTDRKMIWREVETCIADPGEVSIQLFATASDVKNFPSWIGHKRLLRVAELTTSGQATGNDLISYQAILTSADFDAGVGDFLRGSVTFRLSG